MNIMEEEKSKPLDEKKKLEVRMKEYESNALSFQKIPSHRPFLVRLDGKSFSKFTSGFRPPFDINFTNAMILTTSDMITEFSAVTGYTHSDEITIIFKSAINKDDLLEDDKKTVHIYDGRVIKLLTVMSSYCSIRFNYHLMKIMKIEESSQSYTPKFIEKINEMRAYFDARLVIFPENEDGEIMNHMIWRSCMDCERNAVSTYGRLYFSQKKLDGQGKKKIIEMLKEKGVNWENDVPMLFKHGVYLKKMLYDKEEVNGEIVKRCKVVKKTFKIKYSDFFLKVLLEKYWNVSAEDEKTMEISTLDSI